MASNTAPEKATEAGAEVDENLQNTATYLEGRAASGLSPEHQQYLLQRHGTLELDPIPGMGSADPYNWPVWKVS
jgi:hypothetical protein